MNILSITLLKIDFKNICSEFCVFVCILIVLPISITLAIARSVIDILQPILTMHTIVGLNTLKMDWK